MIQTKVMSQMWSIPVYTDSGDYFGQVEDAIIMNNKIMGWKIVATEQSPIFKMIKGAKGVIVHHNHVRAVGDIMLISKSVVPSVGETTAVEMERLNSD